MELPLGSSRSDGRVEPQAGCPTLHDSGVLTPKYRFILESKKPKVNQGVRLRADWFTVEALESRWDMLHALSNHKNKLEEVSRLENWGSRV